MEEMNNDINSILDLIAAMWNKQWYQLCFGVPFSLSIGA